MVVSVRVYPYLCSFTEYEVMIPITDRCVVTDEAFCIGYREVKTPPGEILHIPPFTLNFVPT